MNKLLPHTYSTVVFHFQSKNVHIKIQFDSGFLLDFDFISSLCCSLLFFSLWHFMHSRTAYPPIFGLCLLFFGRRWTCTNWNSTSSSSECDSHYINSWTLWMKSRQRAKRRRRKMQKKRTQPNDNTPTPRWHSGRVVGWLSKVHGGDLNNRVAPSCVVVERRLKGIFSS